MSQAGLALVATTVITAVVHTLIPDHWLPFVLVARSERWSVRRTLALVSLSAMIHVTVSILLAMVVVLVGRGAEMAVTGLADRLEALTAWVLILFGIVYGGWFLRKGGHVHSFGFHPHHNPLDPDPGEGPLGLRLKDISGYTLTFAVGFNPCILLIPCVYGAAQMTGLTLIAVAVAFATSTVVSMVVMTLLGLHGTSRLTSPFLTRYGEALSGGLITLIGVAVLLSGFEVL